MLPKTGSRWWLQVVFQKKLKCNLKQNTQFNGGQNYKDRKRTHRNKNTRVFIFPSRLFPGHPKKLLITVGENVEMLELSYVADGDVKRCSCCEKAG